MNHDPAQAERLRTIEFIDECRDRLLAQLRLRRGEIDQVAGVRDDGNQFGLVDALAKPDNFVRRDRLAEPLVRILAEDLQRLASVNDRAIDGSRHPARHRHMCAYSHARVSRSPMDAGRPGALHFHNADIALMPDK